MEPASQIKLITQSSVASFLSNIDIQAGEAVAAKRFLSQEGFLVMKTEEADSGDFFMTGHCKKHTLLLFSGRGGLKGRFLPATAACCHGYEVTPEPKPCSIQTRLSYDDIITSYDFLAYST